MSSNLNAIESFEQQIKKITDSDYGDFKRKANLYLDNLNDILRTESTEAKKVIAKMRYRILILNDKDIDNCTHDCLQFAKTLKNII